MLGMYLEILKIGHRFCSTLSILNELLLQKELQSVMLIMILNKKNENTMKTKRKQRQKNIARAKQLNPGPFSLQYGMLPFGH